MFAGKPIKVKAFSTLSTKPSGGLAECCVGTPTGLSLYLSLSNVRCPITEHHTRA